MATMEVRVAKRILEQGPLRFGDPTQIRVLRRLETATGRYEVTIRVIGWARVVVEAADEDEAERKAIRAFDGCLDDWYDPDVEEIKELPAEE